jgi:hypothetical protein
LSFGEPSPRNNRDNRTNHPAALLVSDSSLPQEYGMKPLLLTLATAGVSVGVPVAAGRPPAGPVETERVALKTREGFFVRAVKGGGDDVVADAKEPRTSEVFTLEWVDRAKSQVRLRTRDGYYLHAVRGGGDDLDARVKEPRSSEVFTLEWADEAAARARFRTREGFYVHAVTGGGGGVDAKVKEPRSSEVFTLVRR